MAKKWAPILELAEDVRSGKVSALEQVKKSLRLIDEHSEFNAVISKIEKRAIETKRHGSW